MTLAGSSIHPEIVMPDMKPTLFNYVVPSKNDIEIHLYGPTNRQIWDEYVSNHPNGTHCHLSGWKEVIEKTYGHKAYYLIAFYPESGPIAEAPSPDRYVRGLSSNMAALGDRPRRICGILPLVHIRSFFLGSSLVSMPFLNYGGILADDEEVEEALLRKAKEIRDRIRAKEIELRHIQPIAWLKSQEAVQSDLPLSGMMKTEKDDPETFSVITQKVRMLLPLPDSEENLLKSLNSKLRSQIQRPKKEGMEAKIGGIEYLDSFYNAFATNMRDLGSPVHAKRFFREILRCFRNWVKIGIVEYKSRAVAAGIIFGFKGVMEVPWASSLKEYNKLSPNMLLYWSFLEHSAKGGFSYFDFGRSTKGEGAFNFKKQWGAEPILLHWYKFASPSSKGIALGNGSENREAFAALWKNLPICVANFIGPKVRARIPL